ncbi:11232_t:CDS:2, partial [Scutellospora calospora]
EDNLERLVMAADVYRDLMDRLNKASKHFSKALKDYGNGKGLETTYVMCMQTSSQFYENHADVLGKLVLCQNKVLQKDFDLLQKLWDKYSKRAIKEEKAHNDYVGDLDRQIKKIGKDYEKKTKRDNQPALDSYDVKKTKCVLCVLLTVFLNEPAQ